MYKDNVNGVSICTVLDTRYEKEKNEFPVKIRVTHLRKSQYFVTGKKLSEDQWAKLGNSRSPELAKLRICIKDRFDLIVQYIEELTSKGKFTFDSLKIRLGNQSGGTVNGGFDNRIKVLHANGQTGTALNYQAALKSFERYAGDAISYDLVTTPWLENIEKKMLKNSISPATIGIRMRALRTVMKVALKNQLITESQYPFGEDKYQIKVTVGVKEALTKEQIGKIATYDDGDEITAYFRDIWYFLFLCNGFNPADLVRLKFRNIENGEIRFIREKSKRTSKFIRKICVPITPQMQQIIDKWGNKPVPNNYIFDLFEHSQDPLVQKERIKNFIAMVNRRMKKIGRELGMGDVTTSTARRSFASVLKRSGTNLAFISESLGHSNLETTKHYLDTFEREERERNAKLLTPVSE